VASAAIAAAAALFLFAMTAAAVLTMFSVAAAAVLIVVAALVVLAVVMVVTIGSAVDKFTLKIHLHSCIRVTGRARADFNPRVPERALSAAAKTSAYKNFYILIRKKACQRSVADAVGADHPASDDLVVFYIVNFKVFCPSKMLEDVSVVVSCCDFHNCPF
jgi:hypothetical protein